MSQKLQTSIMIKIFWEKKSYAKIFHRPDYILRDILGLIKYYVQNLTYSLPKR